MLTAGLDGLEGLSQSYGSVIPKVMSIPWNSAQLQGRRDRNC